MMERLTRLLLGRLMRADAPQHTITAPSGPEETTSHVLPEGSGGHRGVGTHMLRQPPSTTPSSSSPTFISMNATHTILSLN